MHALLLHVAYTTLVYALAWCINGFQQPIIRTWRNVIGYVDGTHVRIERPKDFYTEQAHYSEHKATHTIVFLVIVDVRGKVVYCSEGYAPGRASEKALFSMCTLFIPPNVSTQLA